ncbi:MAG: SUMF1/EgtB/PvdO family nonheme iron enzyme [Candidatus Micrarchaeota archaeon]
MHSIRVRASNTPRRPFAAIASGLLLSCGMQAESQSETATHSPPYVNPSSDAAVPAEPRLPRPDFRYRGLTRGCPVWSVRVGDSPRDFCIDRFEAHLVEMRGGKELIHPHFQIPGRDDFIARSAPMVRPQRSVNRLEARSFCTNAGKRLCTMHEWKLACMGPETFPYPYGNKETSGKCNTHKAHALSVFAGTNNKEWSKGDMNDPILTMVPGTLEDSGVYRGCVSAFGAYDMVGNIHEWVSDDVDETMISSMPYIGKDKPAAGGPFAAVGNGIFMGGYFSSANENGKGCNYATIAHAPGHRDYSVGFRCCSEVMGE